MHLRTHAHLGGHAHVSEEALVCGPEGAPQHAARVAKAAPPPAPAGGLRGRSCAAVCRRIGVLVGLRRGAAQQGAAWHDGHAWDGAPATGNTRHLPAVPWYCCSSLIKGAPGPETQAARKHACTHMHPNRAIFHTTHQLLPARPLPDMPAASTPAPGLLGAHTRTTHQTPPYRPTPLPSAIQHSPAPLRTQTRGTADSTCWPPPHTAPPPAPPGGPLSSGTPPLLGGST